MGYLYFKHWIYVMIHMFLNDITNVSGNKIVSPSKSLVWGPGLKTEYIVPARFFYIHAVDGNDNNITSSIGKDPFVIKFYDQNNNNIRVWAQQLDRQDGSYIVRYKLFDSHQNPKVVIMYNDKHVGQSPYTLSGYAYHDLCHCPEPSLQRWYDSMNCPADEWGYRQIKEDLSQWNGQIDMEVVADEAVRRFNERGRHSLCHYVVKDNKIYRKTYGEHVGFKMFMDAILLSLTRKVKLPDFEFFVNLGDWPLEKKQPSQKPVPIFSWCGSDDTRDIVMPTYDVTESTLQTMGRVSLDLLSVQGNTGPAWENKTSIGFWRGRDSRKERLQLVRLAKEKPDLIDAKLTNMFFFPKDDDLMPLVKHISFFDFFKYKYQLNIDGTVAAYRFPYLLAGDSLVLKQDSPYYEHFYKDLKPYEHYIPIKSDLSDILEQIQWAKDHDAEAQKIAKNGQEYARNNLMSGDIFCYHVKLFEKYAEKLKTAPKVLDDMELVVEEKRDSHLYPSQCDCHRTGKVKDEL